MEMKIGYSHLIYVALHGGAYNVDHIRLVFVLAVSVLYFSHHNGLFGQ